MTTTSHSYNSHQVQRPPHTGHTGCHGRWSECVHYHVPLMLAGGAGGADCYYCQVPTVQPSSHLPGSVPGRGCLRVVDRTGRICSLPAVKCQQSDARHACLLADEIKTRPDSLR